VRRRYESECAREDVFSLKEPWYITKNSNAAQQYEASSMMIFTSALTELPALLCASIAAPNTIKIKVIG
jgi:hypothetical protein